MDTHNPSADEPATPEYVLAVLRDRHRLLAHVDPGADPTAELTAESTVADMGGGLLLLVAGRCAGSAWVAVAGLVLLVGAWVLTWVAARHIPPASVTFGDLRTFRNLARVLAPLGH